MSEGNTERDCIVIGGGMGGLFTGALLAVRGHKVTVLEKNASIGGGLQCFVRGGEKYETGMHVAGGFGSGDVLDRLCTYLGLRPEVASNDALATVHFLSDSSRYELPCGRKALTDYLISVFPAEREGISSYMDALYSLSREESLFYMQPGGAEEDGGERHSEEFLSCASRFIAGKVADERLRSLLAFLAPMYAGVEDKTPAYLHIMASVLFIEQSCRFVNGSDSLAEGLAEVIRSHGGEVLTGAEVTEIQVEERRVVSVRTGDGRNFSASGYVSDIHPLELMRRLPEGTFPRGYVTRLKEIPLTNSAFKVYLRTSPGTVPFIAHPIFVYRDYSSVWKTAQPPLWPAAVSIFMTPGEDGSASHLTLLSPMDFARVEAWEDCGRFRRSAGYAAWKRDRMEELCFLASAALPQIADGGCVAERFAASPLTFRDWYGTPRGSIYGYAKDFNYLALSRLSVRTKVKNLFLTGQNVNMHGIGGVPMTAIETAEAVEGSTALRNEIANDII